MQVQQAEEFNKPCQTDPANGTGFIKRAFSLVLQGQQTQQVEVPAKQDCFPLPEDHLRTLMWPMWVLYVMFLWVCINIFHVL